MDLFVVPTIGFKLLYGFVIVRLDRRDVVWINVTTDPTADWTARQITGAFPWNEAPRYLIRDRDRIYGTVVTRRLLIGSTRRECLDHVIVLGEAHLRRILKTMRPIATALERIGLCKRTRRSLVRFSDPAP
jgi:hypothetical protein